MATDNLPEAPAKAGRRKSRFLPVLCVVNFILILAVAGGTVFTVYKLPRWRGVRSLIRRQLFLDGLDDRVVDGEFKLFDLEREFGTVRRYFKNELFWGRPAPDIFGRARFRIVEASEFPPPEEAPYPDCLRALRAEVLALPAGFGETEIGTEVQLAAWAFRNRGNLPENRVKAGDVVTGVILKASELDPAAQSLQTADTLETNPPTLYFLADLRAVPSHEEIIALETGGPARSREELVDATISRIKRELAVYGGGSWENWMAKTLPMREALSSVKNAVLTGDVRNMRVTRESKYHSDDARALFLSGLPPFPYTDQSGGELTTYDGYKKMAGQFKSHGIDLIFVPVPAKTAIYPDLFVSTDGILPEGGVFAPQWRKYILELSEAGLEVVDLLPHFLAYRETGAADMLYGFDAHLGPVGIMQASGVIADHVRRRVASGEIPTAKFVGVPGVLSHRYDLEGFPRDFAFTQKGIKVFADLDGQLAIPGTVEYPFEPAIIVFGDSQIRLTGSYDGGLHTADDVSKIGEHLALRLQTPVTTGGRWLATEASLPNIPPGTFRNKKVAIYMTAQGMWEFNPRKLIFDIPEEAFE